MSKFIWTKEWREEIDDCVTSVAHDHKDQLHKPRKKGFSDTYDDVIDFVRVGEIGLAYDLLTHGLILENITLSKEDLNKISRAYEMMDKPSEYFGPKDLIDLLEIK